MKFDWITWSIWALGLIILIVWIIVPVRELKTLIHARKKETKKPHPPAARRL